MTIPQIHVGASQQVGPLSVFPLWWAVDSDLNIATGSQAKVEVRECEEGPQVNSLILSNVGATMALLLEGELLEGGWQNRALVADLVLAPGEEVHADVVCVEAGRWGGTTSHARNFGRATVRVRSAMRDRGVANERQSEVWERISEYDRSLGASPTSSLIDHLEGRAAPGTDGVVDEALRRLSLVRPISGQQGVLVGVAGRPVLVELFADPAGFSEHLPSILTGALLDSQLTDQTPATTPAYRARRLAARLTGMELHPEPTVQVGGRQRRWSHRHPQLTVLDTTIDGRHAHLSALRNDHELIGV